MIQGKDNGIWGSYTEVMLKDHNVVFQIFIARDSRAVIPVSASGEESIPWARRLQKMHIPKGRMLIPTDVP
jgi:hypothetical protein